MSRNDHCCTCPMPRSADVVCHWFAFALLGVPAVTRRGDARNEHHRRQATVRGDGDLIGSKSCDCAISEPQLAPRDVKLASRSKSENMLKIRVSWRDQVRPTPFLERYKTQG